MTPSEPHSWRIRRRIILGTLLFCAVVVLYSVLRADDTRAILETAVVSSFSLAGTVIGAYVFGAVWDDANRRPPQ